MASTHHAWSVSGLAIAIGMTACAQPAFAQDEAGVEEDRGNQIVVTAQRREEAQVDVPITITTLTAETLATANINELSDIGTVTPGLRFDRQNQFVQPTIRGVGTSITTAGGGSNVGVYVDGFYSPNPAEADFDLLNVESIQVLKGPQGTLFGRNTTGGAILIQSADPSFDTTAKFKASYTRFNQVRAQAYLSGGLTDNIAVDAEGLYATGDSYLRNLSTGERDQSYRNWQTRFGIKAELADWLTVKARYQHSEADDPRPQLLNIYNDPVIGSGAPFFAPPGTFTEDPDFYAPGADESFLRSNLDVAQLTIEADLGFADLTSYTQYRDQDIDASLDLDKSGLTILQLGLPVLNKTFTQELLLTSKPGPALQYTAGLFYLFNSDRYITLVDNGVALGAGRFRIGGSEAPTRTYAAFVDMTYEVTPQLFVTAGLRYAHDTVTDAYYNIGATEFPVADIKNDKVTPRVVVRYKPTPDSSIYASYSKGYKAAIIDVGGSCQVGPAFQCNDVQPEDIDAFEVGFKFGSPEFTMEAAAFYYDYKNLQVSLFTAGQAEIINAASSEIYGVEGQFSWSPVPEFTLSAGATYVHGRYQQFDNAPVYTPCTSLGAAAAANCAANGISFVIIPTQLNDVNMQRTPEFTGNVSARYAIDVGGGELALSGNLYYTSEFFFGPTGTQFPGGDYETLALRAQWTSPDEHFFFAIFGDNVTDNRYVTQVQYNNFAIGSTWSEPATYGAEIGFNF